MGRGCGERQGERRSRGGTAWRGASAGFVFFKQLVEILPYFFLFLAMSTPPRRRSRRLASASTAAPSPDAPPPARLLELPSDLLERALSRCDSPIDIARVAAVSLLFHASLALEGIRLWAQERGFELPALQEGEGCAVRWLCYSALLRVQPAGEGGCRLYAQRLH